MRQRALVWTAILVVLLAGCGPTQQATSTPTARAPSPTAGAAATAVTGATSKATTPTLPSASPTPTPAAAASGPKYGGTLRYPLRTDPAVWDAQAGTGGYQDTRVQYNLVNEALFNHEPQGDKPCQKDLTPELASNWRWLDDKTLEVKLRQGIKFHNKPPVNGKEMTAEDVVFGLNRGFFIWPISGIKGQADPIDKMVAVDRYTVQFVNKAPNPGLLEGGLAHKYGAFVLPAGVWDPKDRWEDPYKYWIGTGPFMFKEWVPGVKSVHVRNPNYWKQGLPYLGSIEFRIMPDSSTRQAAMRSGKLDLWNWELSPTSADALKKTATGVNLQECPPFSGFGGIYLRQNKPPFSDVRVRRAFSMAIDRDGILKTVLLGHGYIGGMLPPVHPWYMTREEYPADVRKYLEYRPEEAKKLLVEAGYPDGLTITLSTTPTWGFVYTSAAEAMAATAAKAGFTIKPKFVEYAQYMASTMVRKWPADEDAALASVLRENPLRDVLSLHTQGEPSQNRGYASDLEYDRLTEDFLATVDEAKGKELLRRIQTVGVDKALWVLMPRSAAFSAAQPWVKGYTFSGDAYWGSAMFGAIWLDK